MKALIGLDRFWVPETFPSAFLVKLSRVLFLKKITDCDVQDERVSIAIVHRTRKRTGSHTGTTGTAGLGMLAFSLLCQTLTCP